MILSQTVQPTRQKAPGKRFDYADVLMFQIRSARLPMPVREFTGAIPGRKFQLDLAWADRLFFAECDGGEFLKASARRHGGATDCERWNLLVLAGWTGVRFVGSQVKSGYALAVLTEALV